MDIDAEFKSVAKKSNPCAGLIASNLRRNLFEIIISPWVSSSGFASYFAIDRSIDRE